MKYVVAVSGGVDSVVLLDVLQKIAGNELVVAHFDHGIRSESDADTAFVRGLAQQYGLPFESARVALGPDASENSARVARYDFLRRIAAAYSARIVTAHHQNDIIETIAINILRGTGWRGLAVLNDPLIERPLLVWNKKDIYAYALRHRLEWVEDETNHTDTYLRNRIRRRIYTDLSAPNQERLLQLFNRQRVLTELIDKESRRLASSSRYFYAMIDDPVAIELLRAELQTGNASLTRPQRARVLHAVRTAKPATTYQASNGVTIQFNARDFIVKYPL